MIKDVLEEHKKKMNRIRLEMQSCGSPHRSDLYRQYKRMKKEYDEAIYWLRRKENESSSDV